MAQRNIEILIGRLVTDEAFRTAFRARAQTTLTRFVESGYELTPVEIAALLATPAELWERVAARVDTRLQKASYACAAPTDPDRARPHEQRGPRPAIRKADREDES